MAARILFCLFFSIWHAVSSPLQVIPRQGFWLSLENNVQALIVTAHKRFNSAVTNRLVSKWSPTPARPRSTLPHTQISANRLFDSLTRQDIEHQRNNSGQISKSHGKCDGNSDKLNLIEAPRRRLWKHGWTINTNGNADLRP